MLKVLRIIGLGVGLVGVFLTARAINKPFWKESTFDERIVEMQKEGNYLPYRLRKVLWSREVAIIKVETERIIETLWFGRWIPLIGLILVWPLGGKTRVGVWPEVVIVMIIVAIGVINNNPNPGYFLKFTFLPLITILVRSMKRMDKW